MNDNVYASYNGSQVGFTVRTMGLDQTSFANTGIDANGIAAGPDGGVYIASANHIYHLKADGSIIKDMTFPDAKINYTSVVVRGDRVFASYAGSQQGVTVRDLGLNQLSWFNTGVDANGIAAGPHDDVYIASANHIYHYKTDGTLVQDMTFPDASIHYTDVSVVGDTVYASYNGSQQGFTVRDLGLRQRSWAGLKLDISGIAAGPRGDVYLTSANHILNYKADGTLIKDMTFPSTSINYSSIGVAFTTLT